MKDTKELYLKELKLEGSKRTKMDWIKERILAEKRKHEKSGLDWAGLAAQKIRAEIREIMQELDGKVIQIDIGEYDKQISCLDLMDKLGKVSG